MESEKKTKSFHSTTGKKGGFTSFDAGESANSRSKDSKAIEAVVSYEGGSFEISGQFWDSICSNPDIKKSIDKRIEEEVRIQLKQNNEALLGRIKEEAKSEGYQKGIESSKVLVSELTQKLNEIALSLTEQKHQILCDHEKDWARTLKKLVESFVFSDVGPTYEKVVDWVSNKTATFGLDGRIKVQICSQDYEKIEQHIDKDAQERWELVSDPNLKPGQLYCLSDEGALLFSKDEELKVLETWIQEMTESNKETKRESP